MIRKWIQDEVLSNKDCPPLSKHELPYKEYNYCFNSLNTLKGTYYLVYDEDAFKHNCVSNSYKLILCDGVTVNTLMDNLWGWKNRFSDIFMVFSSYTSKTIYLIDTRGIIFEVSTYERISSSECVVEIDREKGCYLINRVEVYYLTSEERAAFKNKTLPTQGIYYNKDFNKFVRANSHNTMCYLYLTAGASKCGEFIRYFADKGMQFEEIPNILCDDSTINVRIPLDEDNYKKKEVQFLCAKYNNQYAILHLPYKWIGGGLSFPAKWKQKKFDFGFRLPKGKETITFSVINSLRAAYNTSDDYELFKKTLSKVIRLFEKGDQPVFHNMFSELRLLHPGEWECNTSYVLSRLDYINRLLYGTEEIRQKERQEYIDLFDQLEKEGFSRLKSIDEIDDTYLRDKLTAEEVTEQGVQYNYLYKLAYRRSIQLYKDKMSQYESQTLKEMSEKGYKISKWKNESNLFSVVAQEHPDAIYQYRSEWLGQQSLDIFIPSLNVGIEYQGEQHYRPIDFFGGETAFEDLVKRDLRKKQLCIDNNVKLIIWKYDETISKLTLSKKINQIMAL